MNKYASCLIALLIFSLAVVSAYADEWNYNPVSYVQPEYSRYSRIVNADGVITTDSSSSPSNYDDVYLNFAGLQANTTYTIYWYPQHVDTYSGVVQPRFSSIDNTWISAVDFHNSNLLYQNTVGASYFVFKTTSSYDASRADYRNASFRLGFRKYSSTWVDLSDAEVRALTDMAMPTLYIAVGDVHNSLPGSAPNNKLATPTLIATSNFLTWTSVPNAVGYYLQRSNTPDGVQNPSYHYVTDTHYSGMTNGYYRVRAVGDNYLYYDSDYSEYVYYSGAVAESLPTPTGVGYDSDQKHIYWIQKTGVPFYNIYRNGALYAYHVEGGTYDIDVSGSYQVQSADLQNNVSPLSAAVNVLYDSGTAAPVAPVRPSDGASASEWLTYYADRVGYTWDSLTYGISNTFKSALNGISSLVSYVSDFVSNFGDLMAFMPTEIKALIISCISILVVFAIIKHFL